MLVRLEMEPPSPPLPDDVRRYLEEADVRIDDFLVRQTANPIPGFVPSDFPLVYHVLSSIHETQIAPGDRFCEWGSGFGVVAGLAALIGFESYGIEISTELHDSSVQLAEDFDIQVELVCGSFLPDGADTDSTDILNEVTWLEINGSSAYEELELEIDDFDIIYAFPWPGEQEVILQLFDRFAAVGALLITNEERGEIIVRRKTGDTRRRR